MPTPDRRGRSRPPSFAGRESPIHLRSRSSTSDSLRSGSSPNSAPGNINNSGVTAGATRASLCISSCSPNVTSASNNSGGANFSAAAATTTTTTLTSATSSGSVNTLMALVSNKKTNISTIGNDKFS